MPANAVEVRWEVGVDENMSRLVAEGTAIAVPDSVHTVHVEAAGLRPGTHYWYRFRALGEESPLGRTRTLAAPRGANAAIRFGTASCQHFEQGLFVVYDAMVEDNVDFLVHLGDYIYDVSWGHDFRKHESTKDPETLAEYRRRYALYKSDPHLQAAHARFPFICIPDNHDHLPDLDPSLFARRAAAYQVWWEHLPVRVRPRPGSATMPIYRSIDVGDLMRLNLLDTRQFRDDGDVCADGADPNFGFGIYRPLCEEVKREDRTMLGAEQEHWLAGRIADSPARWNAIASTVPFSPFRIMDGDEWRYYNASWDYYPSNRRRVLDAIETAGLSNPIFLSGDIHSSWAIDVHSQRSGTASDVVGSEFVTTSISSAWPPPLADPMTASLDANPHVKFYEPTKRGYMLHTVDPEAWTTAIRVVDSVERSDAQASTLATFRVSNGKPGVDRV